MAMEAEISVMLSQAEDCQHSPEAGEERIRISPGGKLFSELLTSTIMKNKFLFMGLTTKESCDIFFFLQQPQKTNTLCHFPPLFNLSLLQSSKIQCKS